ncbi:MAG: 4Fe-4S binding protein [Clostridia bacterium]|nr:4Fe-4S binding protein [Clostridia bacterium]
MKRQIIKIDEEKCNGCGICVNACHEGALEVVDGKARLVSESYCDGLGDCLPECPMGAISLEERTAKPFDEIAVKKRMRKRQAKKETLDCGCPGTLAKVIERKSQVTEVPRETVMPDYASQLRQWPCQLKLVPTNAPYFDNAHLLIAADCTAFAYANIHDEFMRNKITLIGCPKLDNSDYADKLTEILENNEIKSMTILKMEVPCCNGLVNMAKKALIGSGKMIPWGVTTITTDGGILED